MVWYNLSSARWVMNGLISIGTLVLFHPLSPCCDTVANSVIKVKFNKEID